MVVSRSKGTAVSSRICQEILWNSPMAEPKIKPTGESIKKLNKVKPEQEGQDSFAILEVFERNIGEKPSCPRASR
jgi:hypothetical protein